VAFQDQTLTCKDCGKEFVWTVSEQEFYAQKGFDNAPVRCKDCRIAKKASQQGGGGFRGGDRGERESFPITCAQCGKQDTVPFKPSGDRPVLCRDCFRSQRQG
jgi:CxxC-x17-CxxC domain-containing protein